MQYTKESEIFGGFVVSADGIGADPLKVKAIRNFPIPTNRTELCGFIGMANQLAGFTSEYSTAAVPLRELLKTRNDFVWMDHHTRAFEAVKKVLTSPAVLAPFDPTLETRLETDASRLHGLGFNLMQRHGDRWKLVQCGSCFVTDVESRYSVFELEAIAVQYGMKKCHLFLAGMPTFTLVVEHRPFLSVFNHYTLSQVENLKVQKIKAELQSPIWIRRRLVGQKNHSIADGFSRNLVDDPDNEVNYFSTENFIASINVQLANIDQYTTLNSLVPDVVLDKIRKLGRQDEDYMDLINKIKNGFGKPNKQSRYVRRFNAMKDDLFVDDDLVLYGARIVVPQASQHETLRRLHAPHLGMTKMKQHARAAVFWHGITEDIENMIQRCDVCQERRSSIPKETLNLKTEPLPNMPFEVVSADMFYAAGRHFMVYVDRLSGYPIVGEFNNDPTAAQFARACCGHFNITGVPKIFRSDGGPQFAGSNFQKFLERWGVNGFRRHFITHKATSMPNRPSRP